MPDKDKTKKQLLEETNKYRSKIIELEKEHSEYIQAKDKLSESEKKYRNIAENASFGISVCDESGQCIIANKALADMVGTTVEEVLSQNFHRLKSWQQSGMLETAKEALASNEKKRKSFYVVTTFGKELWLDCTFIPYYERGEKHLLFLTEDITKSKQAEIEMIEYRKNLEYLVDIRTAELEDQKRALERKNIALQEVIGEVETQKSKIKNDFILNINELVIPTLKDIKAKGSFEDKYIDLIMQNHL